jgi:putative transposase
LFYLEGFVTVPVGHRKKCRRIDEPGHAHALTFSCFGRQPFLGKDRSRQWLVDAIERARDRHRFDLWAWVIMPEHAHLLICPRDRDYSISSILTTIKQSVAKRSLIYVRQHARAFLSKMEDRQPNGNVSFRFWQRGGGYDRNLIEPGTIWAEIEYLHANPVRRGLCKRPLDWEWSSAREGERPGTGLLRLNLESLPRTKDGTAI